VKPSRLVNRNITALRGRTSMQLEPELWHALQELCLRERVSLGDMVKRIERRGHPGGRTSAVRVHLLAYFRTAATEDGHHRTGHGTLPAPARAESLPAGWTEDQSALVAAFAG
jgi:predicted DNA-binding ribbon-helix-helix protein